MIKAIIFDFWGTLFNNGVYSPIRQIKEILRIKLPFPLYIIKLERSLMLKRFDDLRSAFENVCIEFNLKGRKNEIDKIVGMWNKNWMTSSPFEESMKVLEELKKKYKIILLSNTDCFSVNRVLDKYDLKGLFDNIYLSYEVGLLKSPKLFEIILDELKLSKDEVIMVGDSIESDINNAERAGIKAVLLDRRNKREKEPKIKNLRELGQFL